MNKMDLWWALGQLDDELISAAARTRKEENIIMMHTRKTNRYIRRMALVAAVVAVFAALGITAYATDAFGIKSRILDADSWFGPETAMISLAGGTESAEFKAASEWEAFETEYVNSGKMDTASLKTGYATAGDAQRAGAYFFYGCGDVTMIETVQSIADKYGLAIHTQRVDIPNVQALLDAEQGNIFPLGEEFVGYLYEDGSYKLDALGSYGESVMVSVTRTVKGTLPPYSLSIRNVDTYTEEEYTNSGGVTVQLMFSSMEQRGVVMYETDESVFHMNLVCYASPSSAEAPVSIDTLKAAVDRYDLTKLDG